MMRGRRGRKRRAEFVPNIDVDAWLAKHPKNMVSCPNQPGNLKLTEEACIKRHRSANEPKYSVIGAEPFNLFVFKMNLKACRDCTIGQKLSQAREKAA